ncbi:DegQ family serine endoprotease [Oceanomicrobium pacificus]|uniref:Do family serine endopeptidase n=1 Tax=Oceanomicrobium pacificus TaxID=2692916 RepID=A0A6B0U0F9_9RHOB|nr:DegQ family serine endoprotease [Oceanomicrobium pacificus]MXU64621.1 Do family serine endopeptidase [Oceanomicrobium pacificus]
MTQIPTLTKSVRALAVASALGLTALTSTTAIPAYAHVPEGGYADLVEQVSPAVVFIEVTSTKPTPAAGRAIPDLPFPPGSPFEEFFRQFGNPGMGQPQQPAPARGLGSGYIISDTGEIVTNNHVVEGATELKVTLEDGRVFEATLVGSDPMTDIALLQIEGAEDLPTVPFGDSDELRVGDAVVAVGNPFGLGGTVTSGIVSALGRNINSGPYDSYIQTDAAINRGNSGGPLFNEDGEVVGMNTAIFSPSGGSVGIGFSIPAKTVQGIVDQLRDTGTVERGWLGVQIQTVTPDLAGAMGLDTARGALVSDVQPDSPALKAKLKSGDLIVAVDGQPVEEMSDLPGLIAAIRAGTTAELTIIRNGEEMVLPVEIGKLAAAESGAPAQVEPASSPLGITVEPLTADLARQMGLDEDTSGVLVASVAPDGPNAGKLLPGDVIEEAYGKPVTSPADLAAAIKSADAQDKVLLRVNRGGNALYVGAEVAVS